jgi:hypothetical protein
MAQILAMQPHLLGKSIASIASTLKSWEPVNNSEYLGVLRYLSQLLQGSAVDAKHKASLRAAFSASSSSSSTSVSSSSRKTQGFSDIMDDNEDESAAQNKSQNQLNVIGNILNSWIPPGNNLAVCFLFILFCFNCYCLYILCDFYNTGLNKKMLCKILGHKDLAVQEAGLKYVLCLVQRLNRVVVESVQMVDDVSAAQSGSAAGKATRGGPFLEHCLAQAVLTYLPDFQLLVNIRAKYGLVFNVLFIFLILETNRMLFFP